MSTYYDREHQRLVYVRQSATAQYWDKRWKTDDLKAHIEQDSQNPWYTAITKQFLPAQSSTKVLEGGCGQGAVVLSLQRAGYTAVGVDYAEQTITQVKTLYPDLDLRVSDVAKLDVPDNFFDGYWSLGVIEHDYHGYAAISREMFRVLKPGGFLFITFPYFNPLRRLKAQLGLYPTWPADLPENSHSSLPTPSTSPESVRSNFYQFALNAPNTIQQFEKLGFTLKYQQSLDGFKGLKDELPFAKPILQPLYSTRNPALTFIRNAIGAFATPLAGHIWLGVFQKNK